MEVGIEIEERNGKKFYFVFKNIKSGVLWVNRIKRLARNKGERACVREWKHAVQLLEQILNGDIS